jgi:hypothetical protein
MKREIPILITLFTGIFLVISFFIPHKPFGDMEQRALVWYAIVSGFAMIIGIDSLLKIHFQKLARRDRGWFHSLLLILGFFGTIATGIESGITHGSPFQLGTSFMYVYTHFIVPLQGTMFALLAFFIASAAYRAFRARSSVAALLLVSAVIVMLGRVPVGEQLSPWFPRIQEWIMKYPQMAAQRGILIGTYLGAAAISLRIILGIEKPYLN